jgi:predicted enzyme related to lactoylglutathione lyase
MATLQRVSPTFLKRVLLAILVTTSGLGAASMGRAADRFELPPIGAGEHHAGKMVWADLVTPDLAQAERFYGGLFDWTFKDIRAAKTHYAVALLEGRPVGGLLQQTVPEGEQRQSAWLTFLAVRDVDQSRRLALSDGAKSLSEPKSYVGRGRQAVFSDPEGAVFAVLASSSGDPPDYLASPGEWIWSALLASDPGKSAAFYQTLFGYDVYDLPSDDGAEHLIFSSDDYARAGANTLPSTGRRHPHWLNFIRVADAAAAVQKAVALGGKVLVPVHEDRHGGHAAVLADPFGAPVGVMEWSESQSKVEPR